jgi:tetratricopeptide (TPR) repeat protein
VGLAAALLVAACDDSGFPDLSEPFAPAGVPEGEDAIDGLIVGHRLMQAGEHELALKAYLRAGSERGLNADVLSALGSANLALGRLGQSERLLRRAIEEDETFAAAWNNLGVVLMETGQIPEASRVFRTAFALDNGESDNIRDNYRLALAKMENPSYDEGNNENFSLVRRGNGRYLLLSAP